MIEISQIIFQLFTFVIIFSFPFSNKNLKKFNTSFTIYDFYLVNFIFFANIALIFSLTNLNFKYLFFIYYFSAILKIILEKKNFFSFNKNLINFIFFIFLNILIFFQISNFTILTWDGLATWSLKMNNFFYGGKYSDLEFFSFYKYSSMFQPHLGSYLWALFSKNTFLQYEYLGRLIFPFIYLLSIFSLCEIINGPKNNITKMLLSITIVILTYDLFLFGGYQEYLMFSIIMFLSKLIYLVFNKKNFYLILTIFLSLNILIWTKQEGVIFSLFFVLILLLNNFFSNNQKIYFSLSIILLLFFNSYFSISLSSNENYLRSFFVSLISNEGNFFSSFKFDILVILRNFFYITLYIFKAFIKYPIWLIILPIFIFLIYKRDRSPIYQKILIFGIMNIILIFYVFSFHSSDFFWLLKVTLDRVVFQTTGFYCIVIILFFKKYYKN